MILIELETLLSPILPTATAFYKMSQPNTFAVFTSLSDMPGVYADNEPQDLVQEVRIGIYDKSEYYITAQKIRQALRNANFTITQSGYIAYESDTKYHHYNIDVQKFYKKEL